MLVLSCSVDEVLLRPFTVITIEGAKSSYAMPVNVQANE